MACLFFLSGKTSESKTAGMGGKKVVLELVVCWEGGAVLIRGTFQVWHIEFYLNKHISSVIEEQL